MVAADESDAVRITNLEGEEEEKRLYAEVATINKIACVFPAIDVSSGYKQYGDCMILTHK